MAKKKYKQGKYTVQNPDKYVGTDKTPRYLSSYELEVFQYLDTHPSVIEWGAESVVVPYDHPIKKRKARYIVDIYVKSRKRGGKIRRELIEIKPSKDCKKPRKTAKKKEFTYKREMYTWIVNQAKWHAAEAYAKARGMTFTVITEDKIF